MSNKPEINKNIKETNEAGEIARFYGFKPIISPTVTKQDIESVRDIDTSLFPEEKAALLNMYFREKMMALPQPVMLYCQRPFPGSKERKKPLRLESSIVSLGSSKSVCECLSLQAAISILHKIGYKNLEVHINSVGDKDSMNEFQKKLNLFVRKNHNVFPADLNQAIKKDILAILKEQKEAWQTWVAECPKSIDFLSEPSRLYFKETLEFLEIMDIPYVIDHHLVGDPDIGSEIIFSVRDEDDRSSKQEVLATSLRFNRLTKKIGYKKELSASILDISARLKNKLKRIKIKTNKPQFYLVQFGLEAKLRSFLVLKELQKAKVSIGHAIAKDKLSAQMGVAENSGASHIILMGQKEALENSVIVRNTATRAQEIVSIPELAEYVKKLK